VLLNGVVVSVGPWYMEEMTKMTSFTVYQTVRRSMFAMK
jgi:hypothetical protein